LLDGTALDQARTGVSAARLAIASYGSLVLDYDGAGEAVSLLPTRHVAVVRATDVVPDMKAAFQRIGPLLRARPSSLVLATGPSATADMGALVRGAHGPETVHVLILET
jgi:L-lactate dehydrogenase complex protein LldG